MLIALFLLMSGIEPNPGPIYSTDIMYNIRSNEEPNTRLARGPGLYQEKIKTYYLKPLRMIFASRNGGRHAAAYRMITASKLVLAFTIDISLNSHPSYDVADGMWED
jgi:hypothetical protein